MPTLIEAFQYARQKHQAGDLAGAARAYQLILQQQPGHVESLVYLAMILFQAGKTEEAAKCCQSALALRPDDPEIHFNLALCLHSLGRLDEAAVHYRQTVTIRPNFPPAWNNLGNVLCAMERYDEAIECLHEAVRQQPTHGEPCYNLGNAYREDGQPAEAVKWCREALRLKPVYSKAQFVAGIALLELGKTKEAELHLREAMRQGSKYSISLLNLAANGLYTENDPSVDELRARLASDKLELLDRSHLHSAIANILDQAGRYDEAFAHFTEANCLRLQHLRGTGKVYDAVAHGQLTDRIIALFTAGYFDRIRGFGVDSDQPIFIVGMPRSGSTLVEQILACHPDIDGAGELPDLPNMVARLPERWGGTEKYPECILRLDAAASRELAEAYLRRLRRLTRPARRITDKLLGNFHHLGLIATLFPKARVIHCSRHPLDVCVSCYIQFFKGLEFTWNFADLAQHYRDYERLMAHWRRLLPLPILDVVYEDVVADPEGQSRRLVEFCGVDWDERCLRFHESERAVRTVSKLQVRRPVYASSIGRWRRYAAHLAPLCAALGLPDETTQGTVGNPVDRREVSSVESGTP